MLAETRRMQIIELLRQRGNGAVSISELSKLLKVSEMTIRRDLDYLEERTVLRRVHGGAVAFGPLDGTERPFLERSHEADPQKKVIGLTAAQLVEDGDVIILDAGTTTREVARNLGCKSNLTVITNNIPVAQDMADCIHVNTILLGGMLKHIELCTVGTMVKQSLSVLSADKVFLSVSGISLRRGVTDPDMAEVEVKQAMIRAAARVILVADSTKWDVTTLVQIAELRQIHQWVTDDQISEEAVKILEEAGIEVITPSRLQSKQKQEYENSEPG